MALSDWIDDLCDVFAMTVDTRLVHVYKYYSKPEFPEAISKFPCALTFPISVKLGLSSGTSYDLWTGKTEIHVVPNAAKSSIPVLVPYFAAIRLAVATHVTLAGKVQYFQPVEAGESIIGPAELTYGSEAAHLGLVFYWTVKELVATTLSG